MEQNKLRCSWCQYHIHEGIGYKPCPNLDHDKIQLRPQVFNGYSGHMTVVKYVHIISLRNGLKIQHLQI